MCLGCGRWLVVFITGFILKDQGDQAMTISMVSTPFGAGADDQTRGLACVSCRFDPPCLTSRCRAWLTPSGGNQRGELATKLANHRA